MGVSIGLVGSNLSRTVLLALIILFAVPGCGVKGEKHRDGSRPRVKIALQVPLTGPFRESGEAIIRGASMALEDKGLLLLKAGVVVDLALFDEASPERATANAELITDDNSIIGVIGHYDSGGAIPASERYHQASLPFIAIAATSPELTSRGLSGIYRLPPRDDQQAEALAGFAKSLRAHNVFIIHDRTLYGQGLSDLFKKGAEARGLRILGYRGVERGQLIFEDVVEEIKAAQPEIVFFGGTFVEAGLLLKEMRDRGIGSTFIGGDGLDSPGFLDVAGPEPGRVYFASLTKHIKDNEAGRIWLNRYQTRYGVPADALSALAYDAAAIMLDALVHASSDGTPPQRSRIAVFLKEMAPYEGISGRIAFDDKGDNRFAGESIMIYEMKRPRERPITPKRMSK